MKNRFLKKVTAFFLVAVIAIGGSAVLAPSFTSAGAASQTTYTTSIRICRGSFVDISTWNGTINFKKMRNAGVRNVMIRAAYGTSQDSKFDTYTRQAKAAGLSYGAYQFSTWHLNRTKTQAMTAAYKQAMALIRILKGSGVKGYVAIDLENESGSSVKMSRSELTEVTEYYCGLLEMAGYKPMLYCSIAWLYNRMVPSDITVPLWIAYYKNTGSSRFPNDQYGKYMKELGNQVFFWQYSSTGSGSKYGCSSSYIDQNYMYRSFIGIGYRLLFWNF